METRIDTVHLKDDFKIELYHDHAKTVKLYQRGVLIKEAQRADKLDKKLFVIDAVKLGVSQTALSDYLDISRQSIHNWKESKKIFGYEGLIHSYNPNHSKNLKAQRKKHQHARIEGDKARLLEQKRKQEKTGDALEAATNLTAEGLAYQEALYAKAHDWQASRYAGIFIYLIVLIFQNQWLERIIKLFGFIPPLFMVFLLMSGKNVRSIEQLKNIRSKEAGILLGIGKLPSKVKIWEWFYVVARQMKSTQLLTEHFKHQLTAGIVSVQMWFIDGHLLPYTGKQKTHYAYNTQRRMPMRGQTNLVTCDAQGRIVDFIIEEGKGDLRARIIEQTKKWEKEVGEAAVMVFDREGYDAKFFHQMRQEQRPFITWEKHINKSELEKLAPEKFTQTMTFNGKDYRFFEGRKAFKYVDAQTHDIITFELRRLYLWNKKSNKRTCGLAWGDERTLSTEDCVRGILTRWAASENTFKHIQTRHPLHYHPGFKLVESQRQEIKNPEVKKYDTVIAAIKKELQRMYKSLSRYIKNDDKSTHQNTPIKTSIEEKEALLKAKQAEKANLPEKVDVSTLSDYTSFKRMDNEGKNIFDFVTASVWNARKTLVSWLSEYWTLENELVDLFYAITHCHGYVKNTEAEVRVRLEPLEQPKRRLAQQQLCRKLTGLGARLPGGKKLMIEVGEDPTKK